MIDVTEREERLAFKYDDDYLVMDEDGILLRKTRNKPMTTIIQGIVVSKIKLGEKIGTENSTRMDMALDLIKEMIKADLYYVKLDIENVKTIKAYIYDIKGRLESDVVSFDSPSFKVQGDTDFHLTYQGGTVDLTVISNDNFQIYSEVDWITGVDTRAGESFHRSVLVQPNPSLHARSSTLTLASPDSYFRETVSISQDGAPVQIPDSEFKAWLVSKYDADGSSEIELAEIPSVTEIVLQSDGIRSLEGIEWFSNLEKLVCQGLSAGQLENLDLSGSPRLTYLDVSDNNLSSLDLSGCPNLKTLDCGGNHLRALELAGNQALEYLDCRGNELESLDLTDNHSLQAIHADGNRLTSLKTPRSEALAELTCRGNDLETLNLSNNRGLRRLDCSENRLQTLNVSAMSGLTYLDCSANALK